MSDQVPPADVPVDPAPQPAPQPAPVAPAPGAAAQGGADAPAAPAPARPVPAPPPAGAHDVPAITDYLPVLLAATSGLLKAASAIQNQVDENQEVPAFYLDMAGNFLGMLGIIAEGYRRNVRRDPGRGGAGGAAGGGGGGALPDGADAV